LTVNNQSAQTLAFEAEKKARAQDRVQHVKWEKEQGKRPDVAFNQRQQSRYELEVEYGETIQVVRDARRRYYKSQEDLRRYKAGLNVDHTIVKHMEEDIRLRKEEFIGLQPQAAERRKALAHQLGGMYPLNLVVDNFFVKVPGIFAP
jgi:hypothetical protein